MSYQLNNNPFNRVRRTIARVLSAAKQRLHERLVPDFTLPNFTEQDFGGSGNNKVWNKPEVVVHKAPPKPKPITLPPGGLSIGSQVGQVECWNPYNTRTKHKCTNQASSDGRLKGLCPSCAVPCRGGCGDIVAVSDRYCEPCEEHVQKLKQAVPTHSNRTTPRKCKKCSGVVPAGKGGYCQQHGHQCHGQSQGKQCLNFIPREFDYCPAGRCQRQRKQKLFHARRRGHQNGALRRA